MTSSILYTFEQPTHAEHIDKIIDILQSGGIIAYPTDVNWAFGCLATHQKAIKKLHALRNTVLKEHPLSLIFADLSQLSEYADISDRNTFRILKKILPGPYTVILSPSRRLPKILADKRQEIGIRIPQRELLYHLIYKLSIPLATTTIFLPSSVTHTSKNLSMPCNSYEIAQHFSHAIDLVIDLELSVLEHPALTTIIDLRQVPPSLIRMGAGAWLE